jgi:hypothetical protein
MDIVCAYKSLTTKEIKKVANVKKVFQTSFYEHVIRNYEDYVEISNYITKNPARWRRDELYSEE